LDIAIIFFIGLIIAAIGIIPPGLINMTAAKISLKEGYDRGIMFSLGASLIVVLQTTIASIFAKYLSNHPNVVETLQRIALGIFILLSIYFFVMAQKRVEPKIHAEIKSKHSRFFQGMLMSSLNVFPIPFQAYMTLTLASLGWMNFERTNIAAYVTGVATGTFAMLYIYILFFDKIKGKSFTSQKSMNYSIGIITAIIAIFTLINVLKNM